MNDDLLKLDTQKSLYPDIWIEVTLISGKKEKFVCRKLVRSVMRKHYEWETNLGEASKAGDAQKVDDLIFEHLCYMFSIQEKILELFEMDELHALMNKLVLAIARRKVERTQEILADAKKIAAPKAEKKIPSRSVQKNLKKRGASGSKK